jgi:hypothetical protein
MINHQMLVEWTLKHIRIAYHLCFLLRKTTRKTLFLGRAHFWSSLLTYPARFQEIDADPFGRADYGEEAEADYDDHAALHTGLGPVPETFRMREPVCSSTKPVGPSSCWTRSLVEQTNLAWLMREGKARARVRAISCH